MLVGLGGIGVLLAEVLSAVLSVVLFALFPLGLYVGREGTVKGFLQYIGLKRPPRESYRYALGLALVSLIISGLVYYSIGLWDVLAGPQSVSGQIRQLGIPVTAALVIVVRAVVATGLAEEIFFRGFLGPQFAKVVGFRAGNAIQALVFGAVHGFLLVGIGVAAMAAVIITTGCIGYLLGHLNEFYGRGSIIPSWVAHAATNLVSFSLIAFVI